MLRGPLGLFDKPWDGPAQAAELLAGVLLALLLLEEELPEELLLEEDSVEEELFAAADDDSALAGSLAVLEPLRLSVR